MPVPGTIRIDDSGPHGTNIRMSPAGEIGTKFGVSNELIQQKLFTKHMSAAGAQQNKYYKTTRHVVHISSPDDLRDTSNLLAH
jgi:hypothetical protein